MIFLCSLPMSSIQGIPQNQVKEPLAFIRKAQVFIYLIFFEIGHGTLSEGNLHLGQLRNFIFLTYLMTC